VPARPEVLKKIVDKISSQEFQKRLGRVEELIAALENQPNPAVREQTRELIQTLLDLHAQGLERILGTVHDAGAPGAEVIDQLGRDQLVSGVLLLHGLHPLDLETRVRNALETVRPRLGLHGGSVEFVEARDDGTVRIRLEGNCNGCPSSRVTLHSTIEEELYSAAPDITSLVVDGTEAPPATIAPRAPAFTECPTSGGQPAVTEPIKI
jgi:Fe-S cluster biogenesis protein NfuA